MRATRRPLCWFWFRAGPDWSADFPFAVWFGIWGRGDLMTRPDDEGRMILAAFDARLLLGPSYEAMQDGVGHDPQRWRFILWTRSDADEIARRLAGSDDGSEAAMMARAKAFRERKHPLTPAQGMN